MDGVSYPTTDEAKFGKLMRPKHLLKNYLIALQRRMELINNNS